jgi:hypothetical protein
MRHSRAATLQRLGARNRRTAGLTIIDPLRYCNRGSPARMEERGDDGMDASWCLVSFFCSNLAEYEYAKLVAVN